MSDEFPRRRGRPSVRREPVYVADADEEAGISDSGIGYAAPQPITLLDAAEPAQIEHETSMPTWEPIGEDTPRDGYEVIVRYGDGEDALVRRARWKLGRRFNGRRWEDGGTWVPVDGMTPLPAEAPTHWLKPPSPPEPEHDADEAA